MPSRAEFSLKLWPGGGRMMPNSMFWLPVGRYSAGGARARLSSRAASVNPATTATRRRVEAVIQCTRAVIHSLIRRPRPTPPQRSRKPRVSPALATVEPRILADRLGITVIATIRLSPTAQLIARAMSRNSCPASSRTKSTGRKTAIVVSVEASTAPQTSRAPS